ncbi:cytochrome d ubiquinol oxidase subunit I [Promicromonospora sp. AC04]|uniref:cytochrome ubiquinol oxidase subunit I n=1 Tax=Promicromonospora sp. AC04 TaxID=2135723 RepID=UPI000D4620F0|nr:cytochrome ubiquinol oxidase subunit I [Promicromonospora sp. AC04]PUB27118.1 cytochrome d ubiquinol oxidase subunit I [Promicromonospora sp. AC04]
MEATELARLQFALLAAVHFVFVLLTLGLGPVVAIFNTRWVRAKDDRALVFENATRFWGQLYLVNYALGIAAGIVLELQFGLHFPGLLDVAGEVFGAPLVVETLAAFFLESTLLGLWVFGWHLFPRALHAGIFWAVVVTGYVSAFAVMVANGFLRNPMGYVLEGPPDAQVARITDAGALITNPAALLSGLHVVGACLAAGGFVLVGVSAWHLAQGGLPGTARAGWGGRRPADHDEDLWRRSLRTGVVTGSLGVLLAIGFGYSQYAYILQVDAGMFADDADGSVMETLSLTAMGFMEILAYLMFLGALPLLLLLIGNAVFRMPRRLRVLVYWLAVLAVPVPFGVAILGWLSRELARQPWVIQGVVRVDDVTSDQSGQVVLVSLVLLVGLMVTLAILDWWVLGRLARAGTNRLVLGAEASDVLRDDGAGPDVLVRFGGPGSGASGAPGAVDVQDDGPEPEAAR